MNPVLYQPISAPTAACQCGCPANAHEPTPAKNGDDAKCNKCRACWKYEKAECADINSESFKLSYYGTTGDPRRDLILRKK